MLLVHEASKPTVVARRANVDEETLRKWRVTHGDQFVRWLRGADVAPDAGEAFRPTALMLAFRKEASISAVRLAAVRDLAEVPGTQRGRYREQVSHRLINCWRDEYRHVPWFDGWLLRGEEPPSHVTVATAQQVRRCRRAWDYYDLCRRADPPVSVENTYVTEWLGKGKIPDVEWLLWLYGAPPPSGAFVVSPALQRLRSEMTSYGATTAARIDESWPLEWRADEATRLALEDAKRVAGAQGPRGQGAWRERWKSLPQATAERMWTFARCATLPACCERAGILKTDYYQSLAGARGCGVEELLRQYLACDGPFKKPNYREVGLVARHFFIASPLMLAFRRVAEEEMRQQAIWGLAKLPGFRHWFRDWVTPGQRHGRRKEMPFVSTAAGDEDVKAAEPGGIADAPQPSVQGVSPAVPLPAAPAGGVVPPGHLNETEDSIVSLVRICTQPILGMTIAKRLSVPYNSHFRAVLSSLKKRGFLDRAPEGGYAISPHYKG
jgi:hypothetical protein